MGTLVLGAAPVAPVRFRHASGEFQVAPDSPPECQACWDELSPEAGETEPRSEPHDAAPDTVHDDLCYLCGHEVERIGAPASLLCSGCESDVCRCAA